ncbi:hypothetical protein ACFLT7_08160 [candidate division KSB1 bacterium]
MEKSHNLPNFFLEAAIGVRSKFSLPKVMDWAYSQYFLPRSDFEDESTSTPAGVILYLRITGGTFLNIGFTRSTISGYRNYAYARGGWGPVYDYWTTHAGADCDLYFLGLSRAFRLSEALFFLPGFSYAWNLSRWKYDYDILLSGSKIHSMEYNKVWRNRGIMAGLKLMYLKGENFSWTTELGYCRYREHFFDRYRLKQLCVLVDFPDTQCTRLPEDAAANRYRVIPEFFLSVSG